MAVLMAMVQVRVMRMLVPQGLVPMHVGVRLAHGPFMLMLVVAVMHMAVVVLDLLMNVLMLVALGEVQPQSNCHQ